mgnify:CR=1 FL=1
MFFPFAGRWIHWSLRCGDKHCFVASVFCTRSLSARHFHVETPEEFLLGPFRFEAEPSSKKPIYQCEFAVSLTQVVVGALGQETYHFAAPDVSVREHDILAQRTALDPPDNVRGYVVVGEFHW